MCLRWSSRRRLEGEIAFGVDADRAVVQVGRADPQHAIVDDHHLGVDHGVDAASVIRHVRIQKRARVRSRPRRANACMKRPRPACMVCASSQEWACFGATSTASSSGRSCIRCASRSAKRCDGEVLVLDVDACARRGRPCRKTVPRPRGSSVSSSIAGLVRAMPTSMPVKSGVMPSRPGIAGGADRRRAFAGAARPARARELRERAAAEPSTIACTSWNGG